MNERQVSEIVTQAVRMLFATDTLKYEVTITGDIPDGERYNGKKIFSVIIERADHNSDMAEPETDGKPASLCGVTQEMLNDLAMISNLPGSPRYAECIRQLVEEVPKLRAQLQQREAQ